MDHQYILSIKPTLEEILQRKIMFNENTYHVLEEVRVKLNLILGRNIEPGETINSVLKEYERHKKKHKAR